MKKVKSTYLDYAAATPINLEVLKAMRPFLTKEFGNPSSVYARGHRAKLALGYSRDNIAKILNCNSKEIIFTAGGTESVNLAILGFAKTLQNKKAHFITSQIEHHCVLNSFEYLKQQGFKTTFLPVDKNGFIILDELKKAVKPETVFISLMYANNEIGTVQPIQEIGKWLKNLNHEREVKGLAKIVFHTDACQAAGYLDLNVKNLNVDLMTLNGSKIYGPKQTGILFKNSAVKIEPLFYGGGQEMGLRPGTENVAGFVGLAKALELVQKNKDTEFQRLKVLKDNLVSSVKALIPNILLNNYAQEELKDNLNNNKYLKSFNHSALPNNLNICFDGVEGEALLFYLDSYGFEVSTASACNTFNTGEPSHVLLAIGRSKQEAKSSIRITLGKYTKQDDIIRLMKILPKLVTKLRKVKSL
jgi:cysteine desulfurase